VFHPQQYVCLHAVLSRPLQVLLLFPGQADLVHPPPAVSHTSSTRCPNTRQDTTRTLGHCCCHSSDRQAGRHEPPCAGGHSVGAHGVTHHSSQGPHSQVSVRSSPGGGGFAEQGQDGGGGESICQLVTGCVCWRCIGAVTCSCCVGSAAS
jgi:hypothetical protein